MFGIIFLIVAAFGGHEVVSHASAPDAAATPPAVTASADPAKADTVPTAPSAPAASPAEAAAPSQPAATPTASAAPAVPVAPKAPKASVVAAAEQATAQAPRKPATPTGSAHRNTEPQLDAELFGAADDDPDLAAAVRLVSDFYDTTPPDAVSKPAPGAAPHTALGPHLIRTTQHYESQGRQIEIEIMRPDNDDRRPAILILHGASGIGDGTFYRNAAEIFAERGYVTFIPHYLPRTAAAPAKHAAKGHARETKAQKGKPASKVATAAPGSIRAGFVTQEKTLRDALDFMAQNPYVDSSRIGVFGMSLGGFHALNLSSSDYRIAAVVDMSGALRGNVMPESNHLAPTLALHGARDAIVPVGRAKSLAGYLKTHGIPYELKIYPDQGHFFRGKAQQDAFERSAGFFGTYLTPSDVSRAARSSDGAQ